MCKDIKSYHIIFRGNVQGVGFRFTAEHMAQRNKIKGWVKNNLDRSVEVLAQGRKNNLDFFILELKNYFSDKIRDISQEESLAQKEFSGFSIRY